MNSYQISSLLTEKDTVQIMFENRKTTLDKNLFTRSVLMNLSKAFDSVTHDLLIAKPHAY